MAVGGAVILMLPAINRSHWLPSIDKSVSEPIVSVAIPTEPTPAAAVNTLVYPVDARGHMFLDPPAELRDARRQADDQLVSEQRWLIERKPRFCP